MKQDKYPFENDNIPVLAMFPEIDYWSVKKVLIPECEIRKNEYGDKYQHWIFNTQNKIVAFIDTKEELKIYVNDQVMWTATGRKFSPPTPTQLERAVRYAWLKLQTPRLQSVKS